MATISPTGVLDSSMAVGIDISPSSLSSLYTSNITNNICHAITSVVSLNGSNAFVHLYDSEIISGIIHAISSMVPPIDSNAFVRRYNIHTSAEDQSLGLEGRGTAGRTPRGTKKNHRSHRTHRWAPYPSVRDAEGSDIWPASVGRHGGLRGNAPLVESTVISVASALRHRSIPMQPHANVVTASGGSCGAFSCDHDDGGSKGVTWADQQTGGMPSGGHLFALQSVLTAAYPPDRMLSSIFPNSPSGSTVWIGDSASSVHGTGSGKFVYNKQRPLPGKPSFSSATAES